MRYSWWSKEIPQKPLCKGNLEHVWQFKSSEASIVSRLSSNTSPNITLQVIDILTQRIPVWYIYIYLYLADLYGKCKEIYILSPRISKFLPELLLPQPIASAGLESITYPGISDKMLKRWAMTWDVRHSFDSEEFDNESFPSRGTLTSCYAFFLSFSFFLCGHFENSMNHAVHTWSFVTEKIRKLTQYLKKWRGCKTSFYLCLMASCQVGRESPEYVTQSSFCSYVCSTTKCC